jgi:hypothetical protein
LNGNDAPGLVPVSLDRERPTKMLRKQRGDLLRVAPGAFEARGNVRRGSGHATRIATGRTHVPVKQSTVARNGGL